MQPSKVSKDQHNIYSSEWIKFRTELKSLLALLLYIKLYIKICYLIKLNYAILHEYLLKFLF